MKLLYIDCNDITKHVVLQDVMEHAVNKKKCMHTYIYIHTHTYIHTYIHTLHTHTYIHTYIHIYTHIHTLIYYLHFETADTAKANENDFLIQTLLFSPL
jgi:hypothetical protein